MDWIQSNVLKDVFNVLNVWHVTFGHVLYGIFFK